MAHESQVDFDTYRRLAVGAEEAVHGPLGLLERAAAVERAGGVEPVGAACVQPNAGMYVGQHATTGLGASRPIPTTTYVPSRAQRVTAPWQRSRRHRTHARSSSSAASSSSS